MAEKQGPSPGYQESNSGYPNHPGYPQTYQPKQSGASKPITVQVEKETEHDSTHSSGGGFLNSLKSGVKQVGKQLGKEIDYCSNKLNTALDTNASGTMLDMFKNGNVVQLVSRASGRCLQIVSLPDNSLIVDGHGPSDPKAFFTHWTVVNEGQNQVRLHNNNNYLCIANGHTCLAHVGPGVTQGLETKFQLTQTNQFVIFESLKERHRHIGILSDGQLKPAVATGREDHAQFGVNVIYTPYPTSNVTVGCESRFSFVRNLIVFSSFTINYNNLSVLFSSILIHVVSGLLSGITGIVFVWVSQD
ncbi:hypothetical protein LOTGIDRAFT_230861 [Lottia gigantea]|uniref:Uncharacterized protein n=1 Tax=Lottia gigantea TaxID=225164 RepID=V4CDF0_LOTGI|nr:hypothetical protein LOTGIDRAFT_230861 [Lottia gigantea]ESO99924.1 hypothetical protein LOTGIDRAFT_230861 [Lottia gigantea]